MERYLPDVYQKSIYTVDYSKLISRGIKCILFDLDNTIVAPSSKTPTKKAKDLFTGLKQKGLKVVIFTNSPKKRMKIFKDYFGIDGVANACKPFPSRLKKIINEYGFSVNEVAIIGDQLQTDVLVGNRVGITTVLVNPITEKDCFVTKFNRIIERRKMKKLRDHDLFCKGRFYD